MYEVIYNIKAENKIKSFIKSYKNIFLKTDTDTGLFYEDLIRQNYINNSEKFYNEIIDKIDDLFVEEKILWYKALDNMDLQTIIVVWNFKLFVVFSENSAKKVRFIEDIEFHKK